MAKRIEPVITDHALVRYIERYHGLDLTPLRNDLANAARDAIAASGAGVKLPGGCVIKLDGKVVVTVLPGSGGRP